MEKAKLRSYLVISGDDLDFQAIQDFTGIAPTRVRRGGEFPGPGHGADEWVYEISGVYVFPIPAETSSMVVLGRGESTFVEDPFFSPCVPSIEGFDPDEENPALQDYVDKYLPLGTVVVLKDGDKPLMVFGRQQKDTANDQVFDYVGCPFPEGNVGPRATFLFNHDDIAWIHFLGYADDEEWAWDDRLTGVNE